MADHLCRLLDSLLLCLFVVYFSFLFLGSFFSVVCFFPYRSSVMAKMKMLQLNVRACVLACMLACSTIPYDLRRCTFPTHPRRPPDSPNSSTHEHQRASPPSAQHEQSSHQRPPPLPRAPNPALPSTRHRRARRERGMTAGEKYPFPRRLQQRHASHLNHAVIEVEARGPAGRCFESCRPQGLARGDLAMAEERGCFPKSGFVMQYVRCWIFECH